MRGVGYRLRIPTSTIEVLGDTGSDVKLFTVCRIRDEQMSLYGFATATERTVFERVCTVSSVGPQIALAILSGISIERGNAVLTEDSKVLEQVKASAEDRAADCLDLRRHR